jgi:hypothetical protein
MEQVSFITKNVDTTITRHCLLKTEKLPTE